MDPALPDWLPELTITNLRAGRGAMTLKLSDGEVEVTSNSTGFDVVTEPPPRVLPSLADHDIRPRRSRTKTAPRSEPKDGSKPKAGSKPTTTPTSKAKGAPASRRSKRS